MRGAIFDIRKDESSSIASAHAPRPGPGSVADGVRMRKGITSPEIAGDMLSGATLATLRPY